MLGYASAIEYACKKLEMDRRTAQELIAVGRALNELPLVDEAFCAGRLRWSRVRLLVRIAVPETEAPGSSARSRSAGPSSTARSRPPRRGGRPGRIARASRRCGS